MVSYMASIVFQQTLETTLQLSDKQRDLYKRDLYASCEYMILYLFMISMNVSSVFGVLGETNGEISDKYPVLIVPAGRAFSIWGLIFALTGVFTIMNIFITVKKGHVVYFYCLKPLFIINNILNGMWSVFFANSYFIFCLISILFILFTNITMYLIIYYSHVNDPQHRPIFRLLQHDHLSLKKRILEIVRRFFEYGWISVYTGWISVATIVNFALVLKYNAGLEQTYDSVTEGEFIATVVMITVAAVIGISFAIACMEWGFLLTVGWAVLNIASRCNSMDTSNIYQRCGEVANVVGSVSIILSIVVMVVSLFRQRGLL